MQKITYINNYSQQCERHGKVIKENGIYVFLPNDTTNKIFIPENKVVKIETIDNY